MQLKPVIAKVKDPEEERVDVLQFISDARLQVISGLRIFDAEKLQVFNDIQNIYHIAFVELGPAQHQAITHFFDRLFMSNKIGCASDVQFGQQVSLSGVWVFKYVYMGKGDKMKFAYSLFKCGNREKVAQVWTMAVSFLIRTENKTMACFNKAVICEVNE